MKRYILNTLYALDHLANVVLLNGSPDECCSSHAYREHPLLEQIINFITRNPEHCRHAFLEEDNEK